MIPLHKLTVALLLSLTSATGSPRVRAPRHRTNGQRREVTLGDAAVTRGATEDSGIIDLRDADQELGSLPPVLLTTPGYYGTLAAVRAFGRAHIPVTTAGPTHWNVSAFSKYVGRSEICPSTTDGEQLISWLEGFGRNNERHVLLPTCDDTAWLYARYAERLSPYYYLASQPISTVHALLHKAKLAGHAEAVGLETPRSWIPTSEEELGKIADEVDFPLLIKPTTQVLFPSRSKGNVALHRSDLRAAYHQLASLAHASDIVAYDATSTRPIVQEFFTDASETIYNISGFIRDGKLCGARAAVKMLQQPRLLGIGLCFEEAPLDAALAERLERLAQRVGYNGIFEAEFVRNSGRNLLIDFNPRFYNQMGFDVARGLPLPLLAYHEALKSPGNEPALSEVSQSSEPTGKVFVNSKAFKLMVMSQRLSGALSPEDAKAWLHWYSESDDHRVDAVVDPDDVWPSRIDALRILHRHLRHPRHFLRSFVMNR